MMKSYSEYLWFNTAKRQEFLNITAQVESAIKKIHPYEIPEIISVPIVAANKDYLKWIKLNSV